MEALHKYQTSNHRPYTAVYANESERLAAGGFDGLESFIEKDLHKKVLQLDDLSEWVLTNTSPEWTKLEGYPSQKDISATSYTFILSDEGKVACSTSGSATTFTVPPESSEAFPNGSVIHIEQHGAGALDISEGVGVTIRSLNSAMGLSGQWAVARLRKIGSNEWLLSGDIAV